MTKNVFIPTTKGLVSATKVQTFSTEEKTQATSNIAAASVNGTYANPAWITALAASKITGTFMKAQQHAQTAYYDAAGTFTQAQAINGPLTITKTGSNGLIVNNTVGDALAIFNASAASVTDNAYWTIQTAGSDRWYVGQSVSALTGNFEIYGTGFGGSMLTLNRTTGAMTANAATFNGNVVANSGIDTRYGLQISELSNGNPQWLVYKNNGSGEPLIFRDSVNSRIHLSLTPAATAALSRLDVSANLYCTENLQADKGVSVGINNSWLGFSDGNNYIGGISNFRSGAGGSATAIINGETGAATFNGTVTVHSNITCGLASEGRVVLVPGGGSAIGYVAFVKPNGTRQGYIGSDSGNNISFTNEVGGKFVFGSEVNAESCVASNGYFKSQESGVDKWMYYPVSGTYYLRDAVNSRSHAIYFPGANSNAALTQFSSRLLVESNAEFSSVAKLGDFAVGTLPSASAFAGYEANVTDSSVTTFGSIVAGGGSSRVKVYSNGTNWTVQAA
jgi:hypothetical protein